MRLQCSHYFPKHVRGRDGRLPCVIYCHCNSGSRRDAEEAICVLIPRGVSVFALDFAGSGLSEGQWVTLGAEEVDDVEAAVEHLRGSGRVSTLGLWGRSMGAVTALLYAQRDPSIAGMVLDSPFSRLTDLMMEIVAEQRLPIPRPLAKLALAAMKRSVSKRASFDINKVSPVDAVSQSFIPALFGHAVGDTFIKISHAEILHSAYAGDKNLIRFDGDHNSRRPEFFYNSVSIFWHNTLQLEHLLEPADLPPMRSLAGGAAATGPTAALVAAARQRSGLPPIQAKDVQDFGTSRLVLLPCAGGATDTFIAEAILGRFYFNNGTNYRQGFLKPFTDKGLCAYGVNASYTAGHPVFGVTGTTYYTEHPNKTSGAAADEPQYLADDNEMDWFDEYIFDWAAYTRYGYDPATIPSTGFKSANPLPPTMLDASGWGPFHSSWGVCMSNPTADVMTPIDDTTTEVALRYHSWTFVNVQDTGSVSHLPRAAARQAYALLTLGPDRPQPDMSPLAGEMDAGDLSAAMGGSDKPYGTGYSTLVSNELCMRLEAIKEGGQVQLAQCNPVAPALDQVFQLIASKKPLGKKKAAKMAAKAAAAAAAAASS